MPDHRDMDIPQIQAAFDDAFDRAVLFHGFTDYMRDCGVFVYATVDPRTGTRPEHLRYRFTCCVAAAAASALPPPAWKRSLDDRLTGYGQGRDLDGCVWGVQWQELYPRMRLAPDSAEALRWTGDLGIPFRDAVIAMKARVLRTSSDPR